MAAPGSSLSTRSAAAAPEGNGVRTGELVVDPPTLINLGFEWFIQGDDNRNASVEVSYRKQGGAQWKTGLRLLRLQGEHIKQGDQLDVIAPNMIAFDGSTISRGAFIVSRVLGQCAAYRTQLFCYLKLCGHEQLGTMNLWRGVDAPA